VAYGQAGNDRIVDTTTPPWHAAVEATIGLKENARCPTGRPHPMFPHLGCCFRRHLVSLHSLGVTLINRSARGHRDPEPDSQACSR
jgi:hypothetical protein